MMHLCEIKVLQPHRASEWASSTFIPPKKDSRLLGKWFKGTK
jgi:hypothetical protein